MITDFLKLQEAVNERAKHIGRILQMTRHFAVEQTPCLVVVAFVTHISEEFVNIAVGRDDHGNIVSTPVPVPLFESATDADLRIWVSGQNQAYRAEKDAHDDTKAAELKEKEVQMLRQLAAKYPDEVG